MSTTDKAACRAVITDATLGLQAGSTDLHATDFQQLSNDFGTAASSIRADVHALPAGDKVRTAGEAVATGFDTNATSASQPAGQRPALLTGNDRAYVNLQAACRGG